MLKSGTDVFLGVPDEFGDYSLRPARVIWIKDRNFTVDLKDSFALAEGEELFLYFEKDRAFTKQAALIQAVELGSIASVDLELQGQPVSAESRQCYRVLTLSKDLSVQIGQEEGCRLLDISMTGFSAIATGKYRLGQVVEATLRHEGKEFSGKARIQSTRSCGLRQTRYGVQQLNERAGGGELPNGMKKICMAVQRRQLRRLAGVS